MCCSIPVCPSFESNPEQFGKPLADHFSYAGFPSPIRPTFLEARFWITSVWPTIRQEFA
jgi:hypothetical protein